MPQCNNGFISKLETFGLVDGPGVRFVVFMQGCNMRCRYCHNPETWTGKGEEWSAEDLIKRAERYKSYWGENGGITVSGGEPLLQIEFVTEFFSLAKSKNIHTALDTSGNPFSTDAEYLKKFDELLKYTDLVILDIKEIDEEKHIDLTKQSNKNILEMAQYLSSKNVPMWIRHVLVSKLTDDENGLKELDKFIKSLDTVERVEILPYHTLGMAKWDTLGIEYTLKDFKVPTDEEIAKAEALLHVSDYQ